MANNNYRFPDVTGEIEDHFLHGESGGHSVVLYYIFIGLDKRRAYSLYKFDFRLPTAVELDELFNVKHLQS